MEIVDVKLEQLIPLTAKEEALRAQLEEKVFTTVRQAYIDIGETLTEIHKRKLYKSTHFTFASYSAEVLDMAKSYAYRYIQAFGVVQNLKAIAEDAGPENVANWRQNADSENVLNCGQISLPKNEAQARSLVGLPPDEQRQIWLQSLQTAPEGKVTAAHIRKTLRTIKGEAINEQINKAKEHKTSGAGTGTPHQQRISKQFQAAFDVFFNAVQIEINTKWKETDRLTVLDKIDGLRVAIAEFGNYRVVDRGYTLQANNVEKLLQAGFSVYRIDKKNLLLERITTGCEWEIVRQFEDEQTLTAEFERLLLISTNLRG